MTDAAYGTHVARHETALIATYPEKAIGAKDNLELRADGRAIAVIVSVLDKLKDEVRRLAV